MGIGLDLIGSKKSGQEFPIEVGLSYLRFQEQLYVICFITDITERKRIEQELVFSESRFRALITAAPDAVILVNQDGLIEQVNRMGEEMFAYDRDELVHQPIEALIPEISHLTHVDQQMAQTTRPGTQPVTTSIEATALRKDGTVYPAEINHSLLRLNDETLVILIVRDITERKKAERELRLLGQIVQQMKDGVILTDNTPDSIVQYVNNAFTQLYGYTKPEILGQPSWILFAGDESDQKTISEERAKSIDLQGEFRVEYRDRRKDGSLIWVSNTSSVIQLEEGKELYDLGIVRDITEQIQLREFRNQQNKFLAALHETSLNILSQLHLDEVLESLIINLTSLLGSKHGYIFIVDDREQALECKVGIGVFRQSVGYKIGVGEGLIGSAAETGQPFIVDVAQNGKDCLDVPLPEEISVVMGVPLRSGDDVIGVICVAHDRKSNSMGGQFETEMLNHFGELASISIENARLFKEVERSRQETEHHNARMERELTIARSVQFAMLPKQVPDIEGWSFAARWKPALEVSGDYYDFVVRDDGWIDLMIADVMDKGAPAALFMVHSKALLRSSLENSTSLLEGVVRSNQSLVQANLGPFVTVFLARINTGTGETVYINAGHPPGLVYRDSENKIEKLASTGIPLGIESNLDYGQKAVKLEKNDFLILYTDGVTEAMNQDLIPFGEDRLFSAVHRFQNGSAEEITDHILREIDHFIAPSHLSDDIALLVARRL